MLRAIYDTNVFVAAGFNRRSASARLLDAARQGEVLLIWSQQTRAETQRILGRIPPLSWDAVAEIFGADGEWTGPLDRCTVDFVTDPEDRKYAALSLSAGVPVVSSDDDLLSHRGRIDVMTPGEFLRERLRS